jgi:hypothetical protein
MLHFFRPRRSVAKGEALAPVRPTIVCAKQEPGRQLGGNGNNWAKLGAAPLLSNIALLPSYIAAMNRE